MKHFFIWRIAVSARLFCALALVVLPLAAPVPTAAAAPRADSEDEREPGRHAAWDNPDQDSAHAPSAEAPRQPASVAAAPAECLGSATRQIRYTSDGVIHLAGCGQTFRLSDIAAAPGMSPDRLQLVDPAAKIWLLKANLKVEEGARLNVVGGQGGDAGWLRLRSDRAGAVWLRAENGSLRFEKTKVTSWDTAANAPDADPSVAPDGTGGRAYVAARSVLTKGRATAAPTGCAVNGGSQEPYEGRMDVVDSEMSYLGYYAGESYGVTWKVYYKVNAADPSDAPPPGRQLYAMVDVFGGASASSFHHNYFGSYTFGGYCMRWAGNTFADNVMYGLDPHDDSDYLTIEGNVFRDNGDHGVICSIECDHLVIRGNQSLRNLHGIMLHRNTNGALVEGNVVRDNRGAGIAIFDSHDAIVRGNTVENNAESAVRLSVGASRNLIENNTLAGLAANSSAGPGYAIYTFKGSDLPASGDGLPKNNVFRGNRIAAYKNPAFKIGDATANRFEANTLAGPAADLSFVRATGNIVRDAEVGKSFRVLLDASSDLALQDSRGMVWVLSRSGLPTIAAPGGSSLRLTYAGAGAAVTATPLDLAVRPQSGSVAVQPSAWSAGSRAWSERPNGTVGAVAHRVGGLQAGACYAVTVDGKPIGALKADASGRLAFSYAPRGASNFALARVSSCAAPAPAPARFALVPLIRR